jgi:hypothetical protein
MPPETVHRPKAERHFQAIVDDLPLQVAEAGSSWRALLNVCANVRAYRTQRPRSTRTERVPQEIKSVAVLVGADQPVPRRQNSNALQNFATRRSWGPIWRARAQYRCGHETQATTTTGLQTSGPSMRRMGRKERPKESASKLARSPEETGRSGVRITKGIDPPSGLVSGSSGVAGTCGKVEV